jgi:hypothetical protein
VHCKPLEMDCKPLEVDCKPLEVHCKPFGVHRKWPAKAGLRGNVHKPAPDESYNLFYK